VARHPLAAHDTLRVVEARASHVNRAAVRRVLPAIAALVATVGVACYIVAAQPLTSPWWLYADADGTYSASALNLLVGEHTHYLDHPGLPEQELLAVTFGAVSLAHGGPSRAWAAGEMQHLDRARPVFRSWAIIFFIGGSILAFFLLMQLLGHWTWGLAGGLLWLAQPDVTDVMQIRPDVLLASLGLLVGFLIVRATERRTALAYMVAAAVLGVALTVKVHAIALLLPLAVAAVIAHPGEAWWPRLRADVRERLTRHRIAFGVSAALWLALAVALNRRLFPYTPTRAQTELVGGFAFLVFDWLLAAAVVRRLTANRTLRRIFDPFYAVVAVALALGVAAPVALVLPDGLQALVSMSDTLRGHNVNQGVKPFSEPFSLYTSFPLRQASIVFILAGIAAVWGIRRRSIWPALWFLAAAIAGVMAAARLGVLRYYALPYVLAIPAALWLFRRQTRAAAPLVVWVLVGCVLLPALRNADAPARAARNEERQAAAATRFADRLLKPGEVALAPVYFPNGDVRWYGLVENFVYWHPDYPYQLLPDTGQAVGIAQSRHARIRYFIGPQALSVTKAGSLALAAGAYEVRPVPGGRDDAAGVVVVELVSGPGT